MTTPTPTEAGTDGAEETSRSPALVLAVSLAVVFGSAAAVFGILAVGDDGDSSGRVADLRRAAGEMGEAFFTYDHQDLDAHLSRVLALSTGSFRNEYEEEFERGLRDLIVQLQSSSTGFVKDVYVSEIDEETAEAIVVLDVDQDGTGGPRTVFDVYALLTFVEVDGEWKVDQVTDLKVPFGGGTDAGSGSGGATTTSVSLPIP